MFKEDKISLKKEKGQAIMVASSTFKSKIRNFNSKTEKKRGKKKGDNFRNLP